MEADSDGSGRCLVPPGKACPRPRPASRARDRRAAAPTAGYAAGAGTMLGKRTRLPEMRNRPYPVRDRARSKPHQVSRGVQSQTPTTLPRGVAKPAGRENVRHGEHGGAIATATPRRGGPVSSARPTLSVTMPRLRRSGAGRPLLPCQGRRRQLRRSMPLRWDSLGPAGRCNIDRARDSDAPLGALF